MEKMVLLYAEDYDRIFYELGEIPDKNYPNSEA